MSRGLGTGLFDSRRLLSDWFGDVSPVVGVSSVPMEEMPEDGELGLEVICDGGSSGDLL